MPINNKYREVPGQSIGQVAQASQEIEREEGKLSGGLVLNVSPQDLPLELGQSPDLGQVRLRQGGLRQDFGSEDLGSAATTRVLALGEHKFVGTGDEIIEVFFRLWKQADTFVMIESWSGTSWDTEIDSGSITVEDVLSGWVSYFDFAFFADGERVLRWDRSAALSAQTDDFTSSNSLTAEDDTVDAAIVPAAAYLNEYTVHLHVIITGPSAVGSEIIVAVLDDGGSELITDTYEIPVSSTTSRVYTIGHDTIAVSDVIASGENLTLELKTITSPGVLRTNTLASTSGTPLWKATKTPNREAQDDVYLFQFTLTGSGSSNIGAYSNNGGGWVLADTLSFEAGTHEFPIIVDGLGSGSSLGLHVASGSLVITAATVDWLEGFEVDVHGFNLPTDGDVSNGVTYQTEGAPSNTLTIVDEDPGGPTVNLQARFLAVFANRIIALQKDGDPQTIGWCINGDPEDWIGTGSDQVIRDSRSDQIDALQALAPFTANTAALFRERSIERVAQTGQASPALGFYPWIEKLGTESPFSVTVVPDGIMFLGHNKQIYFLTEAGVVPVGMPINEEFDTTVSDLSVVEGEYDSVYQEYLLAVPGLSGQNTKTVWAFDLDRFRTAREIIWHKNVKTANRLSLVGDEIVYAGSDDVVRRSVRTGVVAGGFWVSPTINRRNRNAAYTLREVTLRYEAEGATTLTIEASGDGGVTWNAGTKTTLTLAATAGSGEIRRVTQGFKNVGGYDLRFRVSYPSDEVVILRYWEAKIVQRGDIRSE